MVCILRKDLPLAMSTYQCESFGAPSGVNSWCKPWCTLGKIRRKNEWLSTEGQDEAAVERLEDKWVERLMVHC